MLIHEMMQNFPRHGNVHWIGVRPAREAKVVSVPSVAIDLADGLTGDRFRGKPGSRRQVTLIQFEHLSIIASLLGRESIDPADLRRNIVVSGINLLALRGQRFEIGTAILVGTGNCAPCNQMEIALGLGGYNAMRGHGGITASVLQPGTINLNDSVRHLGPAEAIKEYDN
jgi:MOSC domain-containing protein YiiM